MMKACDVIKHVGVGASLLLAGLAMSACAADGGPTDQAANEPIAEVDLANGSRVMFYEPVPGAVAIDQQYPIGVTPVETAGKSAVEVYRSIAPDRPVPEPLAEAQARADEARRDQPAREQPAKPASGVGPESITVGGFKNRYCNDPSFSFINCHTGPNDKGVTTNIDGTHDNISSFETTLCVNSGDVTFRTWVEGVQQIGVDVPNGLCRTYDWPFFAFIVEESTTITSPSGANYFLVVKWNH
jgi:hypothetical protein